MRSASVVLSIVACRRKTSPGLVQSRLHHRDCFGIDVGGRFCHQILSQAVITGEQDGERR
jgi:hypothetical protein